MRQSRTEGDWIGQALVTGAAGGIGRELALQLSRMGYRIIAVDCSETGLAALSSSIELAGANDRVICKVMDLARLEAAEELHTWCDAHGLHVDTLVNNVGFGLMGEHTEQSPSALRNMVVLNNALLMELCLRFGRDMKEAGGGRILNVASLVGFSASPYFAAYSGTKAATRAFSIAFAREMEDYGVTVTCLCPGTTETGFLDAASIDTEASSGMRRFASAFIASPDKVAAAGLRGMIKGKVEIVPSALLNVQAFVLDMLPASLVSSFVKRSIQAGNTRGHGASVGPSQ
ncbi:MAG: SDR family NAD(P)-dependent oxidoreductase [Parvibaculaceae bacterium]